ncbi:MAG: GDP-mannose 4,6-dehydratase [Candidatus Saganbacteria bacterium]|nr:GDP-mannose 4,6-dehydratase [Candidatus Saganbacteria bacterium]
MKVLITGITGFVGSHLAEHLLAEGMEVFGAARWRSSKDNIENIKDKIKLLECDINDAFSVKQMLIDIKPDQVYHLAGQSSVAASWNSPAETINTNVIGQINILEAVRMLKPDTQLHIAGSSEEYGLVTEKDIPINEDVQLRPLSPYSVSKVAQDLLGYQYFKSYGMKIIRTRAFNHTGPRHSDIFVTSNFARQIALIEKGRQEPVVKAGNLEARRDYTDVRDIAKAYRLALQKGDMGEVYNICSGKAVSIRKMLDILLSFSTKKITVETDPSRLRPSDIPVMQGDCAKFVSKTGWLPSIPLEKTLKDTFDYWIGEIERQHI